MKLEFKKASRKKSKLRLLLSGLSGSGKTYSSLLIASGLGKKIAVIDTERGSASLYSHLLDFDVLELPDFKVDTYLYAINIASRSGYEVIIIDSITHAWDQIKEEVEKISKQGNSWSSWGIAGTPMYKRFIEGLVCCPSHIIACSRLKTEWVLEEYQGKDGRTKQKPIRVGLAPEQKGGIEAEFTLAARLDTDHSMEFIKDRTGKFLGSIVNQPGYEFGNQLFDWLNQGEEIQLVSKEKLERFNELISILNISSERVTSGLQKKGLHSKEQLTEIAADEWISAMEETLRNRQNK